MAYICRFGGDIMRLLELDAKPDLLFEDKIRLYV